MGFLLCAAALPGGAAASVATGTDTTLGKALVDHRLLAALAIQGVGALALLVVAVAGGGFSDRPSSGALAGLPWWAWVGGAVQAVTVFSVLVAAGASGAALFSALAVTGGTVAAVPLDHFGPLGFAQREATILRIGDCAVLVAGTAIVARG